MDQQYKIAVVVERGIAAVVERGIAAVVERGIAVVVGRGIAVVVGRGIAVVVERDKHMAFYYSQVQTGVQAEADVQVVYVSYNNNNMSRYQSPMHKNKSPITQ